MANDNIPERIPEPVVRGVASLVCVLLAAVLAASASLDAPWIAGTASLMLCLDFLLRALGRPSLSPLAALSRRLQGRVFSFRHRLIAARPKRFAAGIGAALTALATLSWLLGARAPLLALLGLLLVFSFLEAAFRFCAGCKIFALLVRAGLLREEVCYDCVFPGGEGI